MTRMTGLGALAALAALAACSSDSGGGDPPPPSYTAYEAQAVALMDDWRETPATDPGSLPYAGGGTYEGVLYGDISSGDSYLTTLAGDLTLDVDFSTNTNAVTGEVTDIVDSAGYGLGGELAISGTFIDRTAETGQNESFGGTLTGTLTSEDLGDTSVAGTINGDFLGDDLGAVSGDVAATLSQSSGFYTLDGNFIAQGTE
ncbi:hypothetical protein [Pseudoroseicyclus tamaricis]|uniref:Transferrin-binding protein B C-lobe/N-lobe beta barrel domain-containing protein n=1 Tax=Pseudoroseicyclus tamaricis TaxID=2705421 RepID=A0A6B2JID2_9RHOB|nr:hypothetical protein [Pseudoroseicyclus tamaricis]NDV01123.1 hypothetical protein [Pseudoroseicyclus tamaricis]